MDDFKTDFSDFLKLFSTDNVENAVVKKQYLQLVKKYHPDSAAEPLQKTYNEYMMLLNKVYAQWKAEGKVVIKSPVENETPAAVPGQTYSFVPHTGIFVNKGAKPRVFHDYFEYLLALGADYYWQAHQILLKDWGLENVNPEATVYEALTILEKAKQCFNTILAKSPNRNDESYCFMVQNELAKIYDMNKNISRGLSANNGRELTRVAKDS